jgi:transcriptional regulator with XRE-family HTH domain
VSNICQRITNLRESLGFNQRAFASELDIKRPTLAGYEKGTSQPSADFLIKIREAYHVNIDWLLTGAGEMFLSVQAEKSLATPGYKVPLLRQKVSCGEGVDWEDEQNTNGYIDIFSLVPRRMIGRLYALSVQGNSMVGAGIRDGDYVLFCANENQQLVDDIYVFSLDGDVFCKQLEFDTISKKIKIYSIRVADLEKAELLITLNVEDTDFADRLHIFGRVFSWIHPNFED